MALGLIDDPAKSPFQHLGMQDVDTPATRRLNLEAAIQSIVLLKNDPPMTATSTSSLSTKESVVDTDILHQ